MIINKKRINNIDNIINLFSSDDVYFCVRNNKENVKKLKENDLKDGEEFIPKVVGPQTKKNAYGYRIVHKELPKENREIEISYHLIDWGGNDNYGIAYYDRLCYPIETVSPTCYSIISDGELLRSEKINKTDKTKAKIVANIFLEIFGEFEIIDDKKNAINTKTVKRVPWKLLPIGKMPWDKKIETILKNIDKLPKNRKYMIMDRCETILKYNPDEIYIGNDYFNGYIVYGFKKKNIYLLESDYINNATYVFNNDWQELSKLTKRELILGNLYYKRLIHNKVWKKGIEKILN